MQLDRPRLVAVGEATELQANGSWDPLVGRTLGDCELTERIGRGGSAVVYRARQEKLGRDVVVKILAGKPSPADAERFLGEAKLASQLDHPFAAHVYDFGVEPDGVRWIAMELVRGTPLDELVEIQGALRLEQLVPLVDRLCEVVHTAHEQGLVHRDIKPANVMVLSRAGRLLPKLLDFGVARAIGDARTAGASGGREAAPGDTPTSSNGAFLGSPRYMAPEQWVDPEDADARSDIYALAVLAYVALTGRAPFDGRTIEEIARAHARNQVPPVGPEFPPGLDEVFARGLARARESRFASAMELGKALRDAAGMGSEKRPIPGLEQTVRDAIVFRGPQPLAEVVAGLDAARNLHQARDRLWQILHLAAQYLGLLALSCRSRVGSRREERMEEVEAIVRRLRSRELTTSEWVELARGLARPFARTRDAYPIPEIVDLFFSPSGESRTDPFAPLLAARQDSMAEAGAHEDQIEAVLEDALPALAELLLRLKFFSDYVLAVPRSDGAERWMGTRGPHRRRVPLRTRLPEDQPVLLNEDSDPVLALAPLFSIAEPAAGTGEEMFLFSGGAPRGARMVAVPFGFERHEQSVWEWMREHVLGSDGPEREVVDTGQAPYRGLAPYSLDHSGFFVGREREVEAVVNQLRLQPIVTIVGASGAGKSSLALAGVAADMAPEWEVSTFRPGARPLAALAALAAGDGRDADTLRDRIERTPEAFGDHVRAAVSDRGRGMLVVVDQLEELFTMCRDADERERFAAALASAGRSLDDPVRIVLTLRDDFLMRVEQLAALSGHLARGLHLLGTPAASDLVRILVEPARRVGYEFEDPELPREMVDEVADQPGALPLLSFVASRVWELRDRHFRRLPRKAYRALGGVGGALAQHAEAFLEALPAADRALVREAFRSLITAEGTRAAMTRAELGEVLGDQSRSEAVIERLIDSRLIVATEDAQGDERIELAHETLISAWPRLVAWRREDAEGARLRDQLRSAARQWEERGRPGGLLWRGDALLEYELWRPRYPGTLTRVEEAFAAASVSDAVRGRRLRQLALVAVVAALVAGLMVLYRANRESERQRRVASKLLTESYEEQGRRALLGGDYLRGALLLSEAQQRGYTEDLDFLLASVTCSLEAEKRSFAGHRGRLWFAELSPDGESVFTSSDGGTAGVWRVADGARVHSLDTGGIPYSMAISPRGDRVATVEHDRGVRLWDPKTGALVRELASPESPVWGAAFSPDGSRLATARADGGAALWDAVTGEPIASLVDATGPIEGGAVAFSADGGRVLTTGGNAVGQLWDVATGELLMSLAPSDGRGAGIAVTGIELSRDGSRILTAHLGGPSALWDAKSGALIARLDGQMGNRNEAHFDPAGKAVVTTASEQRVEVFAADTGALRATMRGHTGAVNSVAFDSHGTRVVSGGVDGTARIWDASTGALMMTLVGHTRPIFHVAYHPEKQLVVTASWDGTARLWDAHPRLLVTSTRAYAGPVASLGFTADGSTFVTAGPDGRIEISDGDSGALLTEIASQQGGVNDVEPSPDGALVASAGADGTARVWTRTGQLRHVLRGHGGPVTTATFAPTGETLLTAGHDGTMKLWNAESGALVATLEGHGGPIDSARFSRSGGLVVAYGESGAAPTLWDVGSRHLRVRLQGHDGNSVLDAAFCPHESRVATAGEDATVRVWDSATGQELAKMNSSGAVLSVAFSPDGEHLLSASEDAVVRVWDSRAGTLLAALEGHRAHVNYAAFAHDGKLIVSVSGDHTARIWSASKYRLLAVFDGGHETEITHAAVGPHGRRLLTADRNGTVNLWNLLYEKRSPEEVARLLRCRVPLAIDDGRVVPRPTTPASCKQR